MFYVQRFCDHCAPTDSSGTDAVIVVVESVVDKSSIQATNLIDHFSLDINARKTHSTIDNYFWRRKSFPYFHRGILLEFIAYASINQRRENAAVMILVGNRSKIWKEFFLHAFHVVIEKNYVFTLI